MLLGIDTAPGALALDFVNSGHSARSDDDLGTPDGTVRWMVRQLPGEDEPTTPTDPPTARRLHAEALQLRDAIDRLLGVTAEGGLLPDVTLAILDRAIGAATWRRRVHYVEARPTWSESAVAGSDPLALLAPIALSAIELLGSVDPHRLRRCAADDCRRWFVDTSKGGRRRWCSMGTCGNRAKAARYRRRHQEGA